MTHIEMPGSAVMLGDETETSIGLNSWLDTVAEITRAANRAAPLEELLDLISGATARLAGYDFCAVFAADSTRQSLLIRGSYGLSAEYINTINAQKPIPIRPGDLGEGPSSRAFRSQRPTTVLDISADPPSQCWETIAANQGYCSLLSVPLVVGQVPFGLLNCYTVEKHVFSAGEIILMESMANQAALAIETTGRLADAERRVRRLSAAQTDMAAQLAALRQADENHGELLDVVLRGGGLTAVIASLARMLRCSVVAADAAGRVLASARSDGSSEPSAGRLTAPFKPGHLPVANAPGAAVIEVPPGWRPEVRQGGLVVPVVLDEEVAGQLWALSLGQPFGIPHRQALGRAAAVVALALLKERTAQEVEWRLSRDVFDDLLDVDEQSREVLHARTRQLGADLTEPHTVLVIRRDPTLSDQSAGGEHREAYALRSLLSLVQRSGEAWKGASLTVTRNDHIVVLWRSDGEKRSAAEFADHLLREIRAYAGGWTATISIGPSCVDVLEYGDAYQLACGVLDFVQQSGRRNRVIALDEIGAYRLLLQVKRPSELQSFAHTVLARIHAYDRQHQTKLGATLRVYMTKHCNVALAAKALHVHANTIGYRLRRIEKLLDVDFHDPHALLQVQLALMIERILGD